MLFLLMAYLYKFHFKVRVNKFISFFKRPHTTLTLQPVKVNL